MVAFFVYKYMDKLQELKDKLGHKKKELFRKRERYLQKCYSVLQSMEDLDMTHMPLEVIKWVNEQRNELLDEIDNLTNKLIDTK